MYTIEEFRALIAEISAERDIITRKYDELIMAVESKYPGESRHMTALRYIREAETKQGIAKEG